MSNSIRITKTMAENASYKMKWKMYEDKIKEVKNKVNKEIETLVIKYIPAPVIACVKEYRTYFCCTNNVSITALKKNSTYTENYIYGDISFSVPYNCDTIKVDRSDYEKLAKLNDKVIAIEKECRDFGNKIENALLQLGTYKRVQENLPEAIKFLEVPGKANLPVPVYTELNDMIKLIKND